MIPERYSQKQAEKAIELSYEEALAKATGKAWEPARPLYLRFHQQNSYHKSCCVVLDPATERRLRPDYYHPFDKSCINTLGLFIETHLGDKASQLLQDMPWVKFDLDRFPEISITIPTTTYTAKFTFTLSGDLKMRKIGSQNGMTVGLNQLHRMSFNVLTEYFQHVFAKQKIDFDFFNKKLAIASSSGFNGCTLSCKIDLPTVKEPNVFMGTAEMTNPARIRTVFKGYRLEGEMAFKVVAEISFYKPDSAAPTPLALPDMPALKTAIGVELMGLGVNEVTLANYRPSSALIVLPISFATLMATLATIVAVT